MKNGKAPVHMGLVINGEKSYIALKNYQVEVKYWDKDKGSGKRTSSEGRKINEHLDKADFVTFSQAFVTFIWPWQTNVVCL